jgi:nucleoside-diphosphate-sugar epimerase
MSDLALVTGAPGWAGTPLVHLLRDHYARVRCLVVPGAPTAELGDVELLEGDLRDETAVARFAKDAGGADLFHFAGLIHPARRVRELMEVNAKGTRSLLAQATEVRRVVALSSNSPVGASRDPNALFDEETPCRPYLSYGRSKLAMEQAVAEAPVDAVVLRPCWFYGPGQPPRQTEFMRMVRAGKAPLVGGGRSRRSVSYVDAVADAARLAAQVPDAAGRTYWIADERPYTFAEIVDTIETVLSEDFGLTVDGGRLRLPGVAGDLAQAADTVLQRVGLYHQRLHVLGELNKTIACSVERAKRELGWAPGPGLREGMRLSVEWCLERGDEL